MALKRSMDAVNLPVHHPTKTIGMRTFFILVVFLAGSLTAQGQEYHCIRTDTTFFTNGDHQRAIHIDSVAEFTGHTSYFNYFALGPADESQFCYTDQFPSWIGSHVDVYPNGDHYFFNWYEDSIFIKTSATLNESWICFSFDGGDYIQAKVISVGMEQFLGITDTVKTIRFNAFDLNGNPVNCPCNDLTIKISRSYGMCRTLNFNEFPEIYFMMGSYLDEYDLCGWSNPEEGIQNLTIRQIFDFAPGDEMHIHELSNSWLQENFRYYEIHRVLEKEWVADTVILYTMERCYRREYILSDTIVTGHDTVDLFVNILSHEDPGISLLPETPIYDEFGLSEHYWYYQSDAPVPDRVAKTFIGGFFYDPWEDCITMLIDFDYSKYYIEGLGGPYWNYGSFGSLNQRELVYFKQDNEEWGDPYLCDTLLVEIPEIEMKAEDRVRIYPNPSTALFRVSVKDPQENTVFRIFNTIGKCVRSGTLEKDDTMIHLGELPPGLYLLKLEADSKQYNVTKLIIQ
jgi:hypothetical protein